jgi:hypothetical protein
MGFLMDVALLMPRRGILRWKPYLIFRLRLSMVGGEQQTCEPDARLNVHQAKWKRRG